MIPPAFIRTVLEIQGVSPSPFPSIHVLVGVPSCTHTHIHTPQCRVDTSLCVSSSLLYGQGHQMSGWCVRSCCVHRCIPFLLTKAQFLPTTCVSTYCCLLNVGTCTLNRTARVKLSTFDFEIRSTCMHSSTNQFSRGVPHYVSDLLGGPLLRWSLRKSRRLIDLTEVKRVKRVINNTAVRHLFFSGTLAFLAVLSC